MESKVTIIGFNGPQKNLVPFDPISIRFNGPVIFDQKLAITSFVIVI